MRKTRRIFETIGEINFNSPGKEFSLHLQAFKELELGGICTNHEGVRDMIDLCTK